MADEKKKTEERERKLRSDIHRQTRMGVALFVSPLASLLAVIVLSETLSVLPYGEEFSLTMYNIGVVLFMGAPIAYLFMFFYGLPFMFLLEHYERGSLGAYIVFGIVGGLICNFFFWFLALPQSVFSICCGITCSAICWSVMNIGNPYAQKKIY